MARCYSLGRFKLWAKASEFIEICHKVACGNVGGWNSARLRRASEIVIEQVASERTSLALLPELLTTAWVSSWR